MTRVLVDVSVWQRDYGHLLPYVRLGDATVARRLGGVRWKLRGRCAEESIDVWFEDIRTNAAGHARRVCAGCPVRATCLAAALLYGEEYGIWGGLDPDQREELDARLQEGEALERVVASALATERERLDEAV